ncbi:hypothetical protein ACIBCM_14725 [Streptomyces sp. NPDC051018]|uniref:hypothetical protein n=1 Tax=Streptomyces sp. NPDC051018 TaxID=3365639 RepID=UPI0037AD7777
MADRLTLTIQDVRGIPPAGQAQVTMEWTDPITPTPASRTVTVPADRPALLSLFFTGWFRISLVIRHPDYVDEALTLTSSALPSRPPAEPDTTVHWDNRGAVVTRSGDDISVTVELGRIRQAPLAARAAAGTGEDPSGVFFAEGNGQPRRYASLNLPGAPLTPMWLEKAGIRTLQDSPGSDDESPTALGETDKDGWDRFRTTERTVALADTGGFLWLEYGSVSGRRPGEPRFLVAVWAPKAPPDGSASSGASASGASAPAAGSGAGSRAALDVICYFTPSTLTGKYPHTTYPFRSGYPYALGTEGRAAEQPYVVVGYRHLMRDLALIQSQHVSGRPAVVVLPVFPALKPDKKGSKENGQHAWQPFGSQAGMHRLLLEVIHFLHRFGYRPPGGSGPGGDFSRWQGSSAQVGALPVMPVPRAGITVPEPPPGLGNVTVCGFSSCMPGMFGLLRQGPIPLPRHYPPQLFGADPAEFSDAWREWWDLDLSLNERLTGISTPEYEKRLLAWFGDRTRGRDRRVRLYHSEYTTGGEPAARLFARLAGREHTVLTAHAPGLAEEWRDPEGRWSAAFYSRAFLRADARPSGVLPLFPLLQDGRLSEELIHPFTAAIGFGHASKLRETRPRSSD